VAGLGSGNFGIAKGRTGTSIGVSVTACHSPPRPRGGLHGRGSLV
jgi:hypothetical protein